MYSVFFAIIEASNVGRFVLLVNCPHKTGTFNFEVAFVFVRLGFLFCSYCPNKEVLSRTINLLRFGGKYMGYLFKLSKGKKTNGSFTM